MIDPIKNKYFKKNTIHRIIIVLNSIHCLKLTRVIVICDKIAKGNNECIKNLILLEL